MVEEFDFKLCTEWQLPIVIIFLLLSPRESQIFVDSLEEIFYRVSFAIEEQLSNDVDPIIAIGGVEKCPASQWNNLVSLVGEKSLGYRFGLEARNLNGKTVNNACPIPIVGGLLSRLEDILYIVSFIGCNEVFLSSDSSWIM